MTAGYRSIPDALLHGLLKLLAEQDDFVFLETVRVGNENNHSYLFLNSEDRLVCRAGDDPVAFLEKVQSLIEQGFYVAGWQAYEFGYLLEPVLASPACRDDHILADFGVYRRAYVFDHSDGSFDSVIPGLECHLEEYSPMEDVPITDLSFSQEKDEYLRNIARIKSYIETGDTYQVNYTLKLRFQYSGADASLYRVLRRNQSVAYGAFIGNGTRRILSFSPELFFRKTGSDCYVRPMKGTMHRAPDLQQDALVREILARDEKNRSENVMIVDLLRNDLGRLCKMGTVEVKSLFEVETYETLHQMTSLIKGTLEPGVRLADLFRAVFPCGSVTGAPKIRTMEIIRELESEPRGVYTGAIGFLSPDSLAVFNVPIRTIVLDDDHGEMGVGSGIVYDSDPETEWEECCLKGRFLLEPEPDFQLIETILHDSVEGFWLLDEHLQRLQDSALYWGIPCDLVAIEDALRTVGVRGAAADAGADDDRHFRRVRLLLHKDGRREISSESCAPPRGMSPRKSADISGGDKTLRACVSSEPTYSKDPFLYHKTTRRDMYNRVYKRAVAGGFFDAVIVNERAEVTEGCITNVFIRRGDALCTPPVECGLLNGVLRRSLLSGKVIPPCRMPVREEVVTLRDLEEADEVYLGNSVRGLVRVEIVNPG